MIKRRTLENFTANVHHALSDDEIKALAEAFPYLVTKHAGFYTVDLAGIKFYSNGRY